MTPLMAKHLQVHHWKRALWHAFPAQAGIQSARNARSPHAQFSNSVFQQACAWAHQE